MAHTNNTGEMTAMSRALDRAAQRSAVPHVIHSDSLYTIHMTTGHWMPRCKRNRDMVERLQVKYRRLQRRGAGVFLRHVRSHIRVIGNELADQLAGGGCHDLASAREWLRRWVGEQSAPGGLGDRAGVG